MFAVFFSEENQLHERDLENIRKEKKKYNQIIEKPSMTAYPKALSRQRTLNYTHMPLLGCVT
jgi:hypothetical protein